MAADWLRGHRGHKRNLLENSVDAYILALETINRLSVNHRIEAFAFLICNAWELLLKAHIVQMEGSRAIFRPRKRGELKRTITLREAADRIYASERDPKRRNIERVALLRDEATHFCISDVPKNMMAVFQACVTNYHSELEAWFGISLVDVLPLGMMSIIFDLSRDRFLEEPAVLRRRMDSATLAFLLRQQQEIDLENASLGNPAEFAIVLSHEVKIVKNQGIETVTFATGGDGIAVAPVQIPKRADMSHPHRCKEVVKLVNQRLSKTPAITAYDVVSIVAAHHIQQRTDFFHHQNVQGSPKQYSDAFVEWIITRYEQNNAFFEEARAKYKDLQSPHGRQRNSVDTR